MNILESIREQIEEIQKLDSEISLEAVRIHIERAEMLYEMGKQNGDEQYFTDVIYRTNQAFEGSLKQAYMILADQPEAKANRKRTVDIENFLATNAIFHDRVLHHFKNYRQDWRNKSTHDFRLFFSQSEAFLAIVNVSAYSYVLFNQIIEKIAYNIEKERLEKEDVQRETLTKIVNKEGVGLKSKVIQIIKEFSKRESFFIHNLKEFEFIGGFAAFLETASNGLKVQSEATFSVNKQRLHLDLLIESKGEELIIEVKRPNVKYNSLFEQQVIKYMELAKIENAILWIPRYAKNDQDLEVIDQIRQVGEKKYEVTIIR